jgi:hypothetical protein
MAKPLRWNLPSTQPPSAVTHVQKDVYLFTNTGSPVVLCLSCAAARRRGGAVVELASDKPAKRGRCKDCTDA